MTPVGTFMVQIVFIFFALAVGFFIGIVFSAFNFNNGKYKFNFSFPGIIFGLPTAIIGHSIHGGFWWTLFDLLCWPFVWIKWFVYKDVNVTIIKNAFSWFLE